MIKVNLLRNMGLAKGGVAQADGAEAIAPEMASTAAAKVVAALVFPMLLYVYERINMTTLDENLRKVQAEVQAVKAEAAKFGDAGPKIEMYTKEKARVEKELEVVRVIAQNRLREVKALDAIQSLMPAKTWSKKVTIDENVVKLEGYTTAQDGISDLIRAIDSNVYFSKVEPKSTSEEKLATGIVKKFELEFRIGRQEQAP